MSSTGTAKQSTTVLRPRTAFFSGIRRNSTVEAHKNASGTQRLSVSVCPCSFPHTALWLRAMTSTSIPLLQHGFYVGNNFNDIFYGMFSWFESMCNAP